MEPTEIKLDAAVAAGLITVPLWVGVLHDVSIVASAVAAVCGAIVGLHAVWRIARRRNGK